jgi:competence ComEA-like helix-hairpin-helix protein
MVRYILFSSLIAASAIFIGITLQSAPAQTPPAPANPDVLPDGPGKSAVEHDCLSCHGARTFKNTPGTGTADDWAEIVNKMMSQGADVSDDDFDAIVKYLTANFGPNNKGGGASKPSGDTPPPPSSDKTPPANGSGSDSSKGSSAPTAQINVNTAGSQDLVNALGLPQAEADSIVQYRKDHGNFKNWQDVAAVPGVSSDKIKQNQQRLSF